MTFFSKCLNPFKIQDKFKFDFLPGFLIQNTFGILTYSPKKIVPFEIIYFLEKFRIFLRIERFAFAFFKLSLVE
jgi:hypothetical protein